MRLSEKLLLGFLLVEIEINTKLMKLNVFLGGRSISLTQTDVIKLLSDFNSIAKNNYCQTSHEEIKSPLFA